MSMGMVDGAQAAGAGRFALYAPSSKALRNRLSDVQEESESSAVLQGHGNMVTHHPPPSSVVVDTPGRESGGSWFETCSGVCHCVVPQAAPLWYVRATKTLVDLINWQGNPQAFLTARAAARCGSDGPLEGRAAASVRAGGDGKDSGLRRRGSDAGPGVTVRVTAPAAGPPGQRQPSARRPRRVSAAVRRQVGALQRQRMGPPPPAPALPPGRRDSPAGQGCPNRESRESRGAKNAESCRIARRAIKSRIVTFTVAIGVVKTAIKSEIVV